MAMGNSAFSEAKTLLVSSKVLVHFDVGKPLFLSCDATPYGENKQMVQKERYDEPV